MSQHVLLLLRCHAFPFLLFSPPPFPCLFLNLNNINKNFYTTQGQLCLHFTHIPRGMSKTCAWETNKWKKQNKTKTPNKPTKRAPLTCQETVSDRIIRGEEQAEDRDRAGQAVQVFPDVQDVLVTHLMQVGQQLLRHTLTMLHWKQTRHDQAYIPSYE